MKQQIDTNKTILLLSLPLAVLVIICSLVGLMTPEFYAAETANWQAQAIGQDLVDLFLVVPCLLITSIAAYRNNSKATMIWAGVMLYLSYSFVLYCFDVHFNKLFVIYCLCLGLSFYAVIWFLFTGSRKNDTLLIENKLLIRLTGIYFIFIAVTFYFLWLSEVIPANIQNKIPKSLSDTGLFTNGVHVLDIAIMLPCIFITGIFLLKRKSTGFMLAPVILTFFVLMEITIGTLAYIMKINGIESDLKLSFVMGFFSLVSLGLLIWFLKNLKVKSDS